MTPEELKQRKRRNLAIALSLAGVILSVFVVTSLKLSMN